MHWKGYEIDLEYRVDVQRSSENRTWSGILQKIEKFENVAFVSFFVKLKVFISRNKTNHNVALDRIRNSGGYLTTTEMILFELKGNAEGIIFKQLSKLVK